MHDLLSHEEGEALRVRESSNRGVFVENLTMQRVESAEEVHVHLASMSPADLLLLQGHCL